jgi:hypothetical protein
MSERDPAGNACGSWSSNSGVSLATLVRVLSARSGFVTGAAKRFPGGQSRSTCERRITKKMAPGLHDHGAYATRSSSCSTAARTVICPAVVATILRLGFLARNAAQLARIVLPSVQTSSTRRMLK